VYITQQDAPHKDKKQSVCQERINKMVFKIPPVGLLKIRMEEFGLISMCYVSYFCRTLAANN
jgi:hypothetical protein